MTASRSSRPIISVVTADSAANATLANRISRVLEQRFTVVHGSFEAAAATVIAGHGLPDDMEATRNTVFAVVPSAPSPSIRLIELAVPQRSLLNARTPIQVASFTRGAYGGTLIAQLTDGGVVIDQARVPIATDSGRVHFMLHHVPVSDRAHVLGVHIRLEGATATDSGFNVVDVRNDRWQVLFYDPRPSWTSTFIRRAMEEDPRFSVTHRAVTSRGVSNTAGTAPMSLRDSESLSRFATIVVSAPENLTVSEASALEAFMRRRAGRVVVLIEGTGAGPLDRLAGVSSWRTARSNVPSTIGLGELRGREFTWPSVVLPDASVHVAQVSRDSTRRPIVWSVPVGAGRLVVSGALDAWEHRGDSSGFNGFWTSTLADLSSSAAEEISLELSRRVLRAGEMTEARVTVRDVLLSNGASSTVAVEAALVSDTDSSIVRLWPDVIPGILKGTIVAPRMAGIYRLLAWSGENRVELPLIVASETSAARHDDREIIEPFVSSRGGSVVDENGVRDLPDMLSSAIQPVPRVDSWHPMRSPWWIVPFALLLGLEWWWRRRNGHA